MRWITSVVIDMEMGDKQNRLLNEIESQQPNYSDDLSNCSTSDRLSLQYVLLVLRYSVWFAFQEICKLNVCASA